MRWNFRPDSRQPCTLPTVLPDNADFQRGKSEQMIKVIKEMKMFFSFPTITHRHNVSPILPLTFPLKKFMNSYTPPRSRTGKLFHQTTTIVTKEKATAVLIVSTLPVARASITVMEAGLEKPH